jgi:hypothetical protein
VVALLALLVALACSSKFPACSTCAFAPTNARVVPVSVALELMNPAAMTPPLPPSESATARLAAFALALTLPVAVIRAGEPKYASVLPPTLALASAAAPLPSSPMFTITVSAWATRAATASSVRSAADTMPSTNAFVSPWTPTVGSTLVISIRPTPVRSTSASASAP